MPQPYQTYRPGEIASGSNDRPTHNAYAGTVVSPWYDRPDYAERMIRGLLACRHVDRWAIVIHVDPGGNPDTLALAKWAVTEHPHLSFKLHPDRFGANASVGAALADGFWLTEYAVLCEEDIVPAPDFLEFHAHCRDAYRTDQQVFSCTAYDRRADVEDPTRIGRRSWFHPWGFGSWRSRYHEFVRVWEDYPPGKMTGLTRSWDESVSIVRGVRHEVYPWLARCQNVGERGTGIPNAAWHRANQYNPIWSGMGPQHSIPVAYREVT